MKSFEFMYGDTWYKFTGIENHGWINRQNICNGWDPFCPVHEELVKQLASFSDDQLRTIMGAVIHGYGHGKVNGKQEKIAEFKRVFNLS